MSGGYQLTWPAVTRWHMVQLGPGGTWYSCDHMGCQILWRDSENSFEVLTPALTSKSNCVIVLLLLHISGFSGSFTKLPACDHASGCGTTSCGWCDGAILLWPTPVKTEDDVPVWQHPDGPQQGAGLPESCQTVPQNGGSHHGYVIN